MVYIYKYGNYCIRNAHCSHSRFLFSFSPPPLAYRVCPPQASGCSLTTVYPLERADSVVPVLALGSRAVQATEYDAPAEIVLGMSAVFTGVSQTSAKTCNGASLPAWDAPTVAEA